MATLLSRSSKRPSKRFFLIKIFQNYTKKAVITFNYDRVLETLAELQQSEGGNISRNSFFGITEHDNKMAREVQNIPMVLKLHGSVDWKKVTFKSNSTIERGVPLESLMCNPDQLVIATPGPTTRQRKLTSNQIERVPLWAQDFMPVFQPEDIFS